MPLNFSIAFTFPQPSHFLTLDYVRRHEQFSESQTFNVRREKGEYRGIKQLLAGLFHVICLGQICIDCRHNLSDSLEAAIL